MRKSIIIAIVFIVATGGSSWAFEFGDAAFEQPTLVADEGSHPAVFSSGLLGDDLSMPETKSASKAVLYSLLLPGLGQSYLGEKKQAAVFFALDVAIWTSFVVFTVQANLREDEYQQYARTFAGVASLDHSDDYYGILTEHDSFRAYENEIKSEGRLIFYPEVDVAALDQYFVDHRVADYEEWIWRSADHRRAYQDRRSASKRADRRALYSVAAAIANRVAASFFAYRSVRRMNSEGSVQQTGFSIELGAPDFDASRGLQTGISVVRSF
jgi:hypothetical protein